MLTKRMALVSLAGVIGWSAAAWAADDAAGDRQIVRRGGTAFIQKLSRPALIERLIKEVEPVELPHRDVVQLEAYLVANSGPRRMYRDGFYADNFAVRGIAYDDPLNRTLVGIVPINRDEWQRLRTHLLFNRLLQAEKPAAAN